MENIDNWEKCVLVVLDWKFYLNLAGSEMPMVSIEDMSDRLKESASSIVDAFVLPEANFFRLNQAAKLIR